MKNKDPGEVDKIHPIIFPPAWSLAYDLNNPWASGFSSKKEEGFSGEIRQILDLNVITKEH